jgi:osmoprotectant transport system ATP-binding protein
MTILRIDNIKKNLQNKPILKGINLNIKKGEILGLVGPSGSGKSTLLRCINRLIEIDEGEIFFQNENIKKIKPVNLRRKIVMVHQESVMLPGTVYENVSYGPKLIGEIDKDYIYQCIEHSGLPKNFLQKKAEKLSGGEKKRVGLARALALNPNILLLDEPTSGVDPKNVEKVEKNIVGSSKDLDLTVIWVTHYVEQAMRVCNRIANIKEGVVKSIDKTSDFKWRGAY